MYGRLIVRKLQTFLARTLHMDYACGISLLGKCG